MKTHRATLISGDERWLRVYGCSQSLLFRGSSACGGAEFVQMVSPGLHHPTPLRQMLGIVVGGTYFVSRGVSQLPLDGIGMPLLLLIQ